ncbi:MAG: 30S ribosomal protein S21 [Candidatus Eisenbacteria bacterium]|nr:30S ribosomal protein S21 [Candidatus Eisenbacteria bacterium]
MPGVRVKDGESFERALRRFKKRCEKAGVLSDLRKHQHFEKPSEKRKRKKSAAKRKLRKLKLKQQKRGGRRRR